MTGLIASGALRNGSSKCRVHSHMKSMRTWFTCTGTVTAMQLQLWTSTREDIRCGEHQTGLFLPTCFVHYVSAGHFLVYMCHQNADRYKQLPQLFLAGRNCKYGTTRPYYQHTSDISHVSVFHKVACGEHCFTMACIHFTISQYNICTQVMTHVAWNFSLVIP